MPEPLEDVAAAWPVTSTTDLHRDTWVVALRADQLTAPDGVPVGHARLVLEHPGAAIVLAVDDDQRVIVLRQYRHPAGLRMVELPAGLLDGGPDEEPLDVAKRELREEVELEADTWVHLASVLASPGISAEVQHVYLARGLTPVSRGDFALEGEEADMSTEWVAFDDLHDAVLAGRLGDSPLCLAVLLARARGLA